MNPLQPFALPPMSIFNSDLTLLRILLGFKFPAFRAECLVSIWLEYTYFMESGQAKLPGNCVPLNFLFLKQNLEIRLGAYVIFSIKIAI
jgi:hypothetical protein